MACHYAGDGGQVPGSDTPCVSVVVPGVHVTCSVPIVMPGVSVSRSDTPCVSIGMPGDAGPVSGRWS